MAEFSFDRELRVITILYPTERVTCQEIYDAIRVFEQDPENLDLPTIAIASGKEPLGGGLYIGITLKLIGWKLKFEERPGPQWTSCEVAGGNFLALNENGEFVNPIVASDHVSVVKTSAVSAAIIEAVSNYPAVAEAVWGANRDENQIDNSFGLHFQWQESKIDDIKSTVETTDGKVDTIDTNVDTVNGKIDTVDANVDAISVGISTLDGKANNISSAVSTVQGSVTTVDGKVTAATSTINSINQKVDNIGQAITAINQSLASLNNMIETVDEKVDDNIALTLGGM